MPYVSLLSGILGLLFDSTFLSPLLFCLLLFLFLSCLFPVSGPFSLSFLQKILDMFCEEMVFFCVAVQQLREVSWLVVYICSILPYGTDICC